MSTAIKLQVHIMRVVYDKCLLFYHIHIDAMKEPVKTVTHSHETIHGNKGHEVTISNGEG